MSIEAYLLSYEEFKIDEARRIYKIWASQQILIAFNSINKF